MKKVLVALLFSFMSVFCFARDLTAKDLLNMQLYSSTEIKIPGLPGTNNGFGGSKDITATRIPGGFLFTVFLGAVYKDPYKYIFIPFSEMEKDAEY